MGISGSAKFEYVQLFVLSIIISEYTNENETLEGLSVEDQTAYLSTGLRVGGLQVTKTLNKSMGLLLDG